MTARPRPRFTEAQIERAVKAARRADPLAVVEFVTNRGTIRILPPTASRTTEVDEWFSEHDNDQH